jgi:hypothetical protein
MGRGSPFLLALNFRPFHIPACICVYLSACSSRESLAEAQEDLPPHLRRKILQLESRQRQIILEQTALQKELLSLQHAHRQLNLQLTTAVRTFPDLSVSNSQIIYSNNCNSRKTHHQPHPTSADPTGKATSSDLNSGLVRTRWCIWPSVRRTNRASPSSSARWLAPSRCAPCVTRPQS